MTQTSSSKSGRRAKACTSARTCFISSGAGKALWRRTAASRSSWL
jgi:hypothetical protein